MHLTALFRNRPMPTRKTRSRRLLGCLELLETRVVPSVATQNPIGLFSGLGGTASATAAPPAPFNVNTDTKDQISNEQSIAVNPTNPNNLVASANDYQLSITNKGTINETVISNAHVSFDGGATWTIYNIPHKQYTGTGDPALGFDARGTVFAAFLGDYVDQSTYPDVWAVASNNGGKGWSSPVVIAQNVTNADGSGILNDKPYLAAWGNGNAIVTYTQFNLSSGGGYISSPIFASVTHDAGRHWSAPVNISSNALPYDQFSVPTVAADGSIYVSFVGYAGDPNGRDNYWVVKVDPNTGAALGAPVSLGTVYDGYDYPFNADGRFTLQESQFRFSAFGNIAADPTNAQHLAVVWSDNRNGVLTSFDPYSTTTNNDVIVSQSFDGGQTWSAPAALAVPNDQFYPWAAYDQTGHLQIGYYDRSYDTTSQFGTSFVGNHLYGYTLASEVTPGSLSFSTRQITTGLSDPTHNNAWFRRNVNANFPAATGFLGDYSNIAITPTGVAAMWTDLRDPSGFPGRATQHGQESFFGDPPALGSSAVSSSALAASPTAAKQTIADAYFSSLDAAKLANLSSSSTTSSPALTQSQFDQLIRAKFDAPIGGSDELDPLDD